MKVFKEKNKEYEDIFSNDQVTFTAWITGHLDLTQEEFDDYYKPIIQKYIDAGGWAFVVGDARGADTMAQVFLKEKNVHKVTVFHMFESPRNNCGFNCIGGFKSDYERDKAMQDSSIDTIGWVRPGRENSGTATNLSRCLK